MTEMTDIIVRGWVFYDRDCELCTKSVRRVAPLLRRRGLRVTPLQSGFARRILGSAGINPARLLDEMRVLTTDGHLVGGGDALIDLAGRYWWSLPIYAIARYVPFVRRGIRSMYRKVAASRHCSATGCSLPAAPSAPG